MEGWFDLSFLSFGRTLKATVSVVSKYARAGTSEVGVAGPLKDVLVIFQEELAKDEPVTINSATTRIGQSTLMVLRTRW